MRLAFEPDLAVKLREAGANVIYISFDGVTPYTNPKNHWEIPYVLENLRKAKLGAVLVPTVIKEYNLHEVGSIIRFGVKHADIVRGVNMQPVSIVGRVPRREREKLRVT
ncbi:MAG: radical SAM protein, partial [Thermofilaceae archaeon]